MCVTVERSDISKLPKRLARSVYSEQFELENLLLNKKYFEGIPSKPKNWRPVFQRLPIAADALSSILPSSWQF